MKKLRLTLLLMGIILLKLTAFTQNTSQDSLKCFTIEQTKTIIKDLKKGQICDSITQIQGFQIVNFKTVIKNNEREIEIKDDKISNQKSEINKKNLQLGAMKKIAKLGLPSAFIGGFFLSYFLK